MKIKWYAKIHIDMREREREREAGKSIYMHVCYISYTYVICYVFVYVGRESET